MTAVKRARLLRRDPLLWPRLSDPESWHYLGSGRATTRQLENRAFQRFMHFHAVLKLRRKLEKKALGGAALGLVRQLSPIDSNSVKNYQLFITQISALSRIRAPKMESLTAE
jgi:hypothetical protein